MQYILDEEEYDEYMRFKQQATRDSLFAMPYNDETRNTIIVSAFTKSGKTWCANDPNIQRGFSMIDIDINDFMWTNDSNELSAHIPEFPQNFIDYIRENMGKVDVIFVDARKEVRDALRYNNIDYFLVYPPKHLKDEWNKHIVGKVSELQRNNMYDMFDQYIKELDDESFPTKYRLGKHQLRLLNYYVLNLLIHWAR